MVIPEIQKEILRLSNRPVKTIPISINWVWFKEDRIIFQLKKK